MFSIAIQEKLKNWGLFCTIVIAPFIATLSGFNPIIIGYALAHSFLISLPSFLFRLPVLFNSTTIQPTARRSKLKKYFIDTFFTLFPILMNTIIPFTYYYFYTDSLIFFLLLFTPTIVMNLSKIDINTMLFGYSTFRTLNLNNQNEMDFLRTLESLCQTHNINMPEVYYLDLLDKVTENNIVKFRKQISKLNFPKQFQKIKSDIDYISEVKKRISPNVFAQNSLMHGPQIFVFSSLFNSNIQLEKSEIEGVLLHELGHHAARDSYRNIVNFCFTKVSFVLGILSANFIGLILIILAYTTSIKFQHLCETNADLYASQRGGTIGLISFLKTLEAWRNEIQLNDPKEKQNFFQKLKKACYKWAQSHPSSKKRIIILERECPYYRPGTKSS